MRRTQKPLNALPGKGKRTWRRSVYKFLSKPLQGSVASNTQNAVVAAVAEGERPGGERRDSEGAAVVAAVANSQNAVAAGSWRGSWGAWWGASGDQSAQGRAWDAECAESGIQGAQELSAQGRAWDASVWDQGWAARSYRSAQ